MSVVFTEVGRKMKKKKKLVEKQKLGEGGDRGGEGTLGLKIVFEAWWCGVQGKSVLL